MARDTEKPLISLPEEIVNHMTTPPHIVIVDDHPLFLDGISLTLSSGFPGARITPINAFEQAIRFAAEPGEIDILLLDINMPEGSALSTLAHIKKLRPAMPIVMISAAEDIETIHAFLGAGAKGYIPKSSTVQVMLSAIQLVWSGGIYLPPSIFNDRAPQENHAVQVAPENTSDVPNQLTQRQQDVLRLLRSGKTNKEIANDLGLSEGTVKIHMTAIFKALGVRNRTSALVFSTQSAQR